MENTLKFYIASYARILQYFSNMHICNRKYDINVHLWQPSPLPQCQSKTIHDIAAKFGYCCIILPSISMYKESFNSLWPVFFSSHLQFCYSQWGCTVVKAKFGSGYRFQYHPTEKYNVSEVLPQLQKWIILQVTSAGEQTSSIIITNFSASAQAFERITLHHDLYFWTQGQKCR